MRNFKRKNSDGSLTECQEKEIVMKNIVALVFENYL